MANLLSTDPLTHRESLNPLSIGHVLQHHFPYTPTALQIARQMQLMLQRLGAHQSAYGDRENPAELAAPAHAIAGGIISRPFRIWSANVSIYMQRERWSREDALIVYDPVHLPAVRSHPNILFVMAGKPWMHRSRKRKDRFRRFLNQVAWRSASCIIATETRGLRACGIEARAGEFLFRRVRPGLWHIPPFVDTNLFSPRRAMGRWRGLNPVLFMGELSRRSGFHLFVDVFRRFVDSHPQATLVVAGHPRRRVDLERALARMGHPALAMRAIFLGDLPEAALPELLASARVAVFPLLRDIDAKVPALQAMASGAATLSTSLGGLEDLPTMKCEATMEGLLQAMDAAWADPELGRRQCEQVQSSFSLETWEKAWLDLIREEVSS